MRNSTYTLRRIIRPTIALSLVALTSMANASTISYFSAAVIADSETVYSPAYSNSADISNFQVTDASTTAVTGVLKSTDFGNRSAFASADMATARLKAMASASNMNYSGQSALAIGAFALLGDRFTTLGGSTAPFSWTGGASATFSLTVSGTYDVTSPSPAWSNPESFAFLRLFILKPGSIDSWISTAGNGMLSPNGNDIIQSFSWGLTSYSSTDVVDWNTYQMGSIPLIASGDIATASFNPGGDFDWIVQLNAAVFLPSGDPDASASSDFSHTVDIDYTGPAGGSTYSASGLFPGVSPLSSIGATTQQVPEPNVMLLLLGALCGMWAIGRKRKVAAPVCY